MKKTLVILAVLFVSFALASCSKEKKAKQDVPSVQRAVKLSRIDDEMKAYLDGKHICIVLGYGYNDEAFVHTTREHLEFQYGVAGEESEEDGLIKLFVYPDDFEFAGRTRISKLYDMIKDESLAGIVLLGAPEGMNIPLAKLQDSAEGGKLPYPVFSLFPQDEVLASEATADFVLDYAQKTDSLDALEEDLVIDFDANAILESSIQSMLNLRAAVPADKNLQNFVQKIVGPRRQIRHYTDSETGLQSANHFIFE